MKIQFIGATGTVTGSKYLLSTGSKKILIDCGLFQGLKELRLRNWQLQPFKAREIDAVLLTHAHLDHSGYIPLLVKQGFQGKIYCSHATKELCKILLPDSGFLQEEDARFANKYGFSRHKPALPLYTRDDAERSLNFLHPTPFHEEVTLDETLSFRLIPAGHILGASLIKVRASKKTILFSGDLGRPHDVIMKAPTIIQNTDYLVLESTYGNSLHDQKDPKKELATIINRTTQRGGVVIVPAFAVGRAQTLIYLINALKEEGVISPIPVYLDSPMATDVTELYSRFTHEHKLSPADYKLMYHSTTFINTPEESKELDLKRFPQIIITASGMAEGGRVLHHLKYFISDPKNTVLFTGFQAPGTRGEALTNGVKEVKIHGNSYPVRAEIVLVDTLSAHADAQEIMAWLKNFTQAPHQTFLTHGEPDEAAGLKERIEKDLGWKCKIPHYLETFDL
jgi:metallo-beta-lactamase family protein